MTLSVDAHRFAVVDTETTGLDPHTCRLLQLGIVIARADGTIESEFVTYVHQRIPGRSPLGAHEIHGITRSDLRRGLPVGVAIDHLNWALRGARFVAHNAKFDIGFLAEAAASSKRTLQIDKPVCTLRLARSLEDGRKQSNTLRAIAERFGVTEQANHDALDDSRVVARLLPHLFRAGNVTTVDDLDRFAP
ncbi:MAG: exonuclease domain-containing protein [Actinomycetota bacterium]